MRASLSNLHRQVIHTTADIGIAKVESARQQMLAINPTISVTTLEQAMDIDALTEALHGAAVVVDASDNFATRFAVNAAAFAAGIPLVSGAAIRMEGQISVYHPGEPDSPLQRPHHVALRLAHRYPSPARG